ncbi:hypothetical protein [Amycolatopsis pigmentata]|uniref:DUF222 domain-containing protein n=1 Tax=Amycolatopsis pigmentata TaxID=450801 RepID=A0ABW5FN09_9PSEU
MIADLETLISQVWSPDIRPLAEEAWRCYTAGAIRPSIAATWSAVSADIIVKLTRLADEGDKQAASFRAKVAAAQAHGLTPAGVKAMQQIEAELINNAVEFELIDSIGKRELERIREDRHLCAHPSLRAGGEVYVPRPEVARGHLAIALTTLLVHPPTQGTRLIEEFTNHICDPFFTPTLRHIQATFYDRARDATRRNVIKLAAKAAMLELDPDGRLPPAEHANRMALALRAFAERARDAVRDAIASTREKFTLLDGGTQLRVLMRMAEDDYFWASVDQALASRFESLITGLPNPAPGDPMPSEIAAILALVGNSYARTRLPLLETRYASLLTHQQMAVAMAQPSEYFVPSVVTFLQGAGSWRMGDQVGQVVVQHAPFLTLDTLKAVLTAWYDNEECRRAVTMPSQAVQLFHDTAHLGTARGPAFADFAAKCEASEGEGEYYSYPGLHTALRDAGFGASTAPF